MIDAEELIKHICEDFAFFPQSKKYFLIIEGWCLFCGDKIYYHNTEDN